jgi:hypothetical protein
MCLGGCVIMLVALMVLLIIGTTMAVRTASYSSSYAQHIRRAHPIELNIESGAIRGEYLSIGPNEFAVFKGIPYAAPPVGALRFQVKPVDRYLFKKIFEKI